MANTILTDGTIPDINRDPQPLDSGLTISLDRLKHKVPGKAQKEFNRGTELREKRKFEQAAVHLKKAIEVDPEFVEALNDLGVCYTQLSRIGEAQAQFERATKIDSHYWAGYFNLAVMNTIQGDFIDAERAARTAMDLNRTGNAPRVVLGMALVFQEKFTDEAVAMLEKSREQFPQAHLFLARALAGRGQKVSARSEVEQYLLSKDNSAKELAEKWLQALK